MEALGILAIPAFLLFLILLVMTILMPYYVWKISGNISKNITLDKERSAQQAVQLAAINQELQRISILNRQLLRAYGHEPEA